MYSSLLYIDVIVGFNQTEFTVTENVGQVQLCLVMIVPTRDVTFPGSFPAGVETRDGTATGNIRTSRCQGNGSCSVRV